MDVPVSVLFLLVRRDTSIILIDSVLYKTRIVDRVDWTDLPVRNRYILKIIKQLDTKSTSKQVHFFFSYNFYLFMIRLHIKRR